MYLSSKRNHPYLWLLPSVLLIGVFVLFPIFIVFRMSFSEVSKAGVIGGFCGLENYAKVIGMQEFRTIMLNTLWWVLAVVGLSTVIGFALAVLRSIQSLVKGFLPVKTEKEAHV